MCEREHEGPFLRMFREILALPSPAGREERVAEWVSAKLNEAGLAPETDNAGNVLVRASGEREDAPLVMLAAHMDEIGVVVTNVEEDGLLHVGPSGGLRPGKIGERAVDVIGDTGTVRGVLSFGSAHTSTTGSLDWSKASIITGLSATALEEAGVRPGSSAVPIAQGRGPVVFGEPSDPLVGAWTFDDRAGVITLVRLARQLSEGRMRLLCPMILAFTVHEEGGCHGAKVLAQRERPEVFIAVDGCPMPEGSGLKLDGRPGVWSKDKTTHFDQRLVRALMRAAREAGTGLQPVVYEAAASDASAVYAVGAAPRVATVGHVRENSHGYEVARLAVFDNLLATLAKFAQTFDNKA